MICILYVNAVGFCLGLVALLLERAMPAAAPRRWIWFVIIPISMAIPGFYRVHHSWSIVDAFEQQAAQPAVGNTPTASLTVLDRTVTPFNPTIDHPTAVAHDIGVSAPLRFGQRLAGVTRSRAVARAQESREWACNRRRCSGRCHRRVGSGHSRVLEFSRPASALGARPA